jgi:hypothetical protein
LDGAYDGLHLDLHLFFIRLSHFLLPHMVVSTLASTFPWQTSITSWLAHMVVFTLASIFSRMSSYLFLIDFHPFLAGLHQHSSFPHFAQQAFYYLLHFCSMMIKLPNAVFSPTIHLIQSHFWHQLSHVSDQTWWLVWLLTHNYK